MLQRVILYFTIRRFVSRIAHKLSQFGVEQAKGNTNTLDAEQRAYMDRRAWVVEEYARLRTQDEHVALDARNEFEVQCLNEIARYRSAYQDKQRRVRMHELIAA